MKRIAFVFVAVFSVLLLGSSALAHHKPGHENGGGNPNQNEVVAQDIVWDGKKVFVCKYVGTPGVNERLQSGQNPINPNANSIPQDPVVVGSYFADQHGRSYVLAYDIGQPEPDVSECPGGDDVEPEPFITAEAACQVVGSELMNVVTVSNIGDAAGDVTVNGQLVSLDPGESQNVNVAPGVTIEVTVDGQPLDVPTPACENGRGAGDPETPATPQVNAPTAGVNAGGGAVMGSLAALTASAGSLGYGVVRLRKQV